jgi:hypothetical protein
MQERPWASCIKSDLLRTSLGETAPGAGLLVPELLGVARRGLRANFTAFARSAESFRLKQMAVLGTPRNRINR